ncbi:MAG: tetratricopeptide repeat protein [Candidatus Levyibacteriota bacterium]
MKEILSGRNYIFFFIILGLIVFTNALFGNFVWDDKVYIINNPDLTPFNLFKLFGPNIFNKAVYYRPIPATYFSLLLNIFADQTFFYHTLQLILHITNSILVFLIFRKFFNAKISLFLASIFLVHPMQVESVSYIAAAVSPIFTFFGLSVLYILMRFEFSKILTTGILLFLILASILTKETGLMFGLLCIFYTLLFKRKMLVPAISATILAVVFYFLLRFQVGHVFFNKSLVMPLPIMHLSFFARLILIPKIVLYYLGTFLFPIILISDQNWIIKQISLPNFFLPLFFAVTFCAGLIFLGLKISEARLKAFYFFFLGWFVLGMIPHLQIVPLDMTVADRWFYFPLIGLLGLVGALVKSLSGKKKIEQYAYIVLGLFVLFLSVRTMARNIDWQSPLYLYSHDIIYEQDNFDMQNNLGNELFQAGDIQAAKPHFEKSIALAPEQSMNYTNLATVYAVEKNYNQAYIYFDKAMENDPNYYPAYEKLGYVYLSQKDYLKAKGFLKKAISRFPDQPILYTFLAEANYKIDNREEALQAAIKAYELLPNSYNLFIYESLRDGKPIQ